MKTAKHYRNFNLALIANEECGEMEFGFDQLGNYLHSGTVHRFTATELGFAVRQACLHNEMDVTASTIVGCFTCCHLSAASSVKDFAGEGANRTACCPIRGCGAATVIGNAAVVGESSMKSIDRELLLALREVVQGNHPEHRADGVRKAGRRRRKTGQARRRKPATSR